MNSPRTSKKKRSPSTSRKVKKESVRNAAEAVQPRYRQARKPARSETRKPRHATAAADQAKWLPIQTIKARETKPRKRSKRTSRFISKGRINNQLKITTMTKAQLKKTIDKEIRAMRSRITDIVKNRIADQIIDDLGDETGELMGKLTVDFVDDSKLTDYAYGKIYDALLEELIKYLKNPR